MRWFTGIIAYLAVWITVASTTYFVGINIVDAVQSKGALAWKSLEQHSIGENLLSIVAFGPANLAPIVALLAVVHLINLDAWDRHSKPQTQRTSHSTRVGLYIGLIQLPCFITIAFATKGWAIAFFSLAGLIAYPCCGYVVGRFWHHTDSIDFRDW